MKCFKCVTGNLEISNSRKKPDSVHIWRRRQCTDCRFIYTTTERPVVDKSFYITHGNRKKDAQIFQSSELLESLFAVFSHTANVHLVLPIFYRLESELFIQAAQKDMSIKKVDFHRHIVATIHAYDTSAALVYGARYGVSIP